MRLDAFIGQVEFLPINTVAMRRAAAFWAEARQQGRPKAPDLALDGDVILAAQAATLDRPDVVIATTNPEHLSRFVTAELWIDIARSRCSSGLGQMTEAPNRPLRSDCPSTQG